jgi:hypothetical protein
MENEDFLERISDNQKSLYLFWHQQFLEYPGVVSKIRYRIPFYYYRSWLCYINPQKANDGIELVFIQGNMMQDDSGCLQSRGRKMVAGIMLSSLDEDLTETIHELFAQAIIIDSEKAERKKR